MKSQMVAGICDADWGKKEYKGVREDGTAWKKLLNGLDISYT